MADVFLHDAYLAVHPATFAWTSVLLAAVGVGLLVQARRRLTGTTLTGPCCWAVASSASVGSVELFVALGLIDAANHDAWRFIAAMSVFTPGMSLLGAKRPQDQAWHFVVGSLWGILALPAAEVLLLRPGQALAVIDFRAWFLMVLIGLNVLVLLPTRHFLAALLLGGGQWWLVTSYLPWWEASDGQAFHVATGLGCMVLALETVRWTARQPAANAPFDRLWLDFRDSFGALWAARVLERVNASASQYAWPIRLGWNGFHAADKPGGAAEISPQLAKELRQNLVNLLRRFVSVEWIAARLEALPSDAGAKPLNGAGSPR